MSEFRILVSSADPSLARFIDAALPGGAFEVLPSCLAKDAVEVVLDQSPDLLLFEVDRKSGSPAETLRIIRKVRPELRIIALSSDSCPEDAEIVEVGLFYYATRPVGADLVQVIEAAVHTPGSRRGP